MPADLPLQTRLAVSKADAESPDRQVYCYEDSKLLKLFASVVRVLYDYDVLGEDTIKFWYKKGSQPKVCRLRWRP